MHHTPGLDGSFTKSHFCAGHLEGKKDTCGGDSGGPLLCEENSKYIVHGITSSGPAECGKKNKPGIYTRVSDFITWIEKTMNGFRYHWFKWKRNKCSVTCGRGQRTETRTCLDKDDKLATECDGISRRNIPCRNPPCIKYHWSPWKTTCSVTCNKGIATSTRYCADANDAPTFPNNCPGQDKKIEPCVLLRRIGFHWTDWVPTCSAICGEETETSTQNCVDDKDNPSKPDNSTGEKKKIETCVKPECIEYHWGEWFKATECSASCGTGEIEMKRKCLDSDNVEVLDTSKCNPGKDVELRTCNLKPCPEESSTSYHWGQWRSWSTCRLRMRGGNVCNGFKSSTRDCLIGSEDVNPRRCSDEYPGEDYYRESSCRMKTSNCP
uniref:hemicentin-1-like n=1 Tax=Styela clava TaxID=7725 RepID=UPI001939BD68|nr:hemicentin-1-like [Styela clava]